MKKNIGIFIFDEAEVLDFAGPFEVFSVASQLYDHSLFEVFTVAEQPKAITAINGLSVNPTYDFQKAPSIDILLLAGGEGTKQLLENQKVLDWIASTHTTTHYTASICSGARMLGKLGLLDHQPYCTHHQVYEDMQRLVSTGQPQKGQRFVQAGKVFTSGGISAGIDLSFHLLALLTNKEVAEQTAQYMEYRRVLP
ncbi:MAG: DJ-1/PfpI family protein [Thermonemataceae bacterium]